MLYKCEDCGYISDEEISVCPKCGSKNIGKVSKEEEILIKKSRKTNYLHMKIAKKLVKIQKCAQDGIKENLDPNCVKIFKRLERDAYESYQSIMAELQAHVQKKKWG